MIYMFGGGVVCVYVCVRARARPCVFIELVCSKVGSRSPAHLMLGFYYSFRDVMAKGGGRRLGVCARGSGMEGGLQWLVRER